MDKQERKSVLARMSPAAWYTYCILEASYDQEFKSTKVDLAATLHITIPTLNKYLREWGRFNLIKSVPKGYVVAQIDAQKSGIEVPSMLALEHEKRRFKTPIDVIKYFCTIFEQVYGEKYTVSNWGMTGKNVKKLLEYTDDELESGIKIAIKLYESKWVSPRYPRPTLGQLSAWLFQQALPYAEKASEPVVSDDSSPGLLEDFEKKGWI